MNIEKANQIAIATFQEYSDHYGYLRSLVEELPVDNNQCPVPTYTYPAIDYLKKLDFTKSSFFGYNAGLSSLWWAHNAMSVITIETNINIHNYIGTKGGDNLVTINIHADDTDSYSTAIKQESMKFDVIEISGESSASCAEQLKELVEAGEQVPRLIILNNSSMAIDTHKVLSSFDNYIPVDFCGIGPRANKISTTTFYISTNINCHVILSPNPILYIN